jgi:hypothetical protein
MTALSLDSALPMLQKRHTALAPIRADTDNATRSGWHRREFLHCVAQNRRAGRTERMAQRYTAPVGVATIAALSDWCS